MDLKTLQKNWNEFGKLDPLSAIYKPETKGKKWQLEEFFQLGRDEIDSLIQDVVSLGFNLARQRALDFGCGVGRTTQALASYFEVVSGVDIAPSMIDLAKHYNRYPGKCAYFLNEADHLRIFPDHHFNFIYSNITLQHMEPRYCRNYLKEFMRVMAPGGLLVFQLPSERKIRPEDQKFLRKIKRSFRLLIPKVFLNAYYRIRGIELEKVPSNHPQMEMYAIRKEEVVYCLEQAGGKVIRVSENENSGPHWVSLKYFVSKL